MVFLMLQGTAKVVQQASGGYFEEIQNLLEGGFIRMIGVRNIPEFELRSEIKQVPDLVGMGFRANEPQGVMVLPVHHENEIELFEIRLRDSARPLSADVDAPTGCNPLGTRIGRRVRKIGMGSCRVDHYPVSDSGMIQQFPEYPFGHGGAADIAHATKKNFDFTHNSTF
jgi:hypothetical protein